MEWMFKNPVIVLNGSGGNSACCEGMRLEWDLGTPVKAGYGTMSITPVLEEAEAGESRGLLASQAVSQQVQ